MFISPHTNYTRLGVNYSESISTASEIDGIGIHKRLLNERARKLFMIMRSKVCQPIIRWRNLL
jgi:hypothetical protein